MKPEPVKDYKAAPHAVRASARAPRWVAPALRTALVFTDACLSIFAFLAAFYLREGVPLTHANGNAAWSEAFAPYAALLPFLPAVRLLLIGYYDLYRIRGEFSFVTEAARVFKAVALGSLLLIAIAFIYRGGIVFRTFSYSRAVFGIDFLLAFAGIGAVRML